MLAKVSPIYFFEDITSAVSIHHGREDKLVPVQWSMQTCEQLKALNVLVECHFYEDMPHTFFGPGDKVFIQYNLLFFDRYLFEP